MKHLRRIFLKFYLLFADSKVEAELATRNWRASSVAGRRISAPGHDP